MNQIDAIVVGGGAAGLFAAGFAAKQGAKVLLLDRNPSNGSQGYDYGKGRCNVTNDCTEEVFCSTYAATANFCSGQFIVFLPNE